MTCELSRQRLLEQLDGAISGAAARDLERHLASCASCRGFAADLSAIADASASLAPIDPPEHVWLQLAGRWRREHGARPAAAPAPLAFQPKAQRTRHWAFYGLAAAATLAMAAGSGWIAWRATASDMRRPELLLEAAAGPTGNASSPEAVLSAQKEIEVAEEAYMRAIAGYERVAREQMSQLEPQIARSIETNLVVIDEAIKESRAAAMAQPDNPVWRTTLFEALKKKVTLLQDTISLVSEVSRGNQAGASRLSGT